MQIKTFLVAFQSNFRRLIYKKYAIRPVMKQPFSNSLHPIYLYVF
jgi:hypothetical protein